MAKGVCYSMGESPSEALLRGITRRYSECEWIKVTNLHRYLGCTVGPVEAVAEDISYGRREGIQVIVLHGLGTDALPALQQSGVLHGAAVYDFPRAI